MNKEAKKQHIIAICTDDERDTINAGTTTRQRAEILLAALGQGERLEDVYPKGRVVTVLHPDTNRPEEAEVVNHVTRRSGLAGTGPHRAYALVVRFNDGAWTIVDGSFLSEDGSGTVWDNQ